MIIRGIFRRLDSDMADMSARFSDQQILDAINDAQLAVVGFRPESNVAMKPVPIIPNQAVQSIPADGVALIEIAYTVPQPANEDAATPAVQAEIITREDRKKFGDQVIDWMVPSVSAAGIQHYFYEPEDLLTYFIYPVPIFELSVMMRYGKRPAEIVLADGETLATTEQDSEIKENFRNAVLFYTKFKLYSVDEADPVQAETAMKYLQLFYQELGIKMKAEYRIVKGDG